MAAPLVIRRGSDIIHVHNIAWAHKVIFGRQQLAQDVEDCFSQLAKKVSDSMEVEAVRSFQGFGQALAGCRRELDKDVVCGLHEAAGFVRHLTQVGDKGVFSDIYSGVAAIKQKNISEQQSHRKE